MVVYSYTHAQRNKSISVKTRFNAVTIKFPDFAPLFETLNKLKGGVDHKKEVIKDVITESHRFKRRALVKLLEDFLSGLEKNGNSASVTVKREINSFTNSLYGTTNNHS